MTQTGNINEAFKAKYDDIVQAIENTMEGYLVHDPGVPEILMESMVYSLRSGGKRLRPVMVVLACELCGGEEVLAMPAAAAMEMVHTYSLIHDDLPAMDNDDFRRGKPTNHKVFGEGIAILAGDALLTYAFKVLAKHVREDKLVRKLILELADAAGSAGMIGGQVRDLTWENTPGDLDTVKYIHTNKTAMMFRAAMRMGAICGGANPRMVDRLGDYGLKLGLAFQIVDDVLDVTGTQEETGKMTQKDEQAGKLTYPSVVGLEESKRHADRLMNEALATINPLGDAGEPLKYLAGMLINRNK